MPQPFTLYPDLTARENVDFVASLFGMLWRTRHRRTREVLELVDLWDVRSRRAGALIGRDAAPTRARLRPRPRPALLFLDEPTAGIDPLLRAPIWDELHRLRDAGRTLLVTTQYVNEAESCDTRRADQRRPPDRARAARGRCAAGDRRRLVEIETEPP